MYIGTICYATWFLGHAVSLKCCLVFNNDIDSFYLPSRIDLDLLVFSVKQWHGDMKESLREPKDRKACHSFGIVLCGVG